MKKLALTLTAIATLVMSGSTASANDIVKVLTALQGNRSVRGYAPPVNRYRGFDRGVRDSYTVTRSSCDRDRDIYSLSHRSDPRGVSRLRAIERAERLARLERIAELQRLERLAELERSRRRRSTHVNFRIGVQDNVPPLIIPPTRPSVLPVPPVIVDPLPPALPPVHHHPPAFGEIVTCEVPLYNRVRVRDRHNIARNARPMTIAIKAPGACDHACSCCADRITYVRVLAPRCEPKCVKVSPCGRHVRLDFGKYEIDVVTYDNYVKVDYDN